MTRRILAVDDDPRSLELLRLLLEKAGHTVETAPAGVPALTKADASPPDLVLLDVEMPGMDGYEVCRTLRQGPKTWKVPVIMVTASPDLRLNRQAYEAGAQACIPKPVRRETLLSTIDTILATYRPPAPGNDATPGKRRH
jgi:CheY-like chemotaxis protein